MRRMPSLMQHISASSIGPPMIKNASLMPCAFRHRARISLPVMSATVPTPSGFSLPDTLDCALVNTTLLTVVVAIAVAQPVTRLIAPFGGAIEPLVHAPEPVQPARKGGIGVVNDAVLECERAHSRPLPRVGGHVGAGHR